jgi:hypothetical protein
MHNLAPARKPDSSGGKPRAQCVFASQMRGSHGRHTVEATQFGETSLGLSDYFACGRVQLPACFGPENVAAPPGVEGVRIISCQSDDGFNLRACSNK